MRALPTLVEPSEPVYEVEITGETEEQRKNREVRNQEKRVGWENHHVIKARGKGVLCNSFRWDEADAKVRSYKFLCLGAEGQRQIQQKRPNLELHYVSIQELMTTLEDVFVTTRIIAIERYNFICRKQKKTESLEQFHSDLEELASRADCRDREDEWVRHMVTAHMNNDKIAEELLAQTRSPQDAYEYAIRREKGIEHSRTMKINPFGGHQITPKHEPVKYSNIQNVQRGQGTRGRPFQRESQDTRGQQRASNTSSQKQCYKCGNQYNQNHLQSCPAKYKICAKCAKRDRFAKVCRSTQLNYLEDTQIDHQMELETESLETEKDPVAFVEFSSSNGWDDCQIDNFSVLAIAESFEIKITRRQAEEDLNGHIVKLKTNSEQLFAVADSGSPMSFLNEKIARRIQYYDKKALFKTIATRETAQNLACYNGETIVLKGRLIISIESGG